MAMSNQNAPPATSRVSPKTIEKAVHALLKWRDSKSETLKPQLLEHEEYFYLVVTLKKIPSQTRTNPYKIPVPHALQNPQLSQELCLIVDDRPHSNLNKASAKSKIESEQIPVSKVLKLSKLKSDYRPFEAKRKLCDSYDMFLADKRIVPLLPGLLGKHFYKKKKIPVPVNLTHKNWKEQIERVCSSALLFLKTGTCSVVKVARLSMEKEEIMENVTAAINGVAEIVPRKWGGVRSLHLKLLDSLALPLYQAVPDVKLRIEGVKEEEEMEKGKGKGKEKGEEVGQDEGKKGESLGKKRGRIHEVRYMDGIVGEVLDEDEMGTDKIEDGDVREGEDGENGEMGAGKLVSKKSRKGDKAEEKVSGKSKGVKKLGKLKNKDGLTEKRDLSTKGKTEDGLKKRKVGFPVEEESAGEKAKKSGGMKLKNGETKFKAKKSKKAAE